jgi:hypothetical protein
VAVPMARRKFVAALKQVQAPQCKEAATLAMSKLSTQETH